MCSHDVGMCVPTTSDWIAVLECACVGVCVCAKNIDWIAVYVCVHKTAIGSLCRCVCIRPQSYRHVVS